MSPTQSRQSPRTAATEPNGAPGAATQVVRLDRRRIDTVLIALGGVVTIVLLIAGGLLWWGSDFAGDYVGRELRSQNITFPDNLAEERPDLSDHAGEVVDSGAEAEAYASYIAGHIENVAAGATYAELSGPERQARTALNEALASGAPDDQVAQLEDALAAVEGQRETIFRGEMLRGTLLNTYAWSTIGRIAGIASIAAFAASVVMLVLVTLGVVHKRKLGEGYR